VCLNQPYVFPFFAVGLQGAPGEALRRPLEEALLRRPCLLHGLWPCRGHGLGGTQRRQDR
jgi:hypothetical protein